MKTTTLIGMLLALLPGIASAESVDTQERAPAPAKPPDKAVQHLAVRFHLVTDLPMTKREIAMTNWITPEMIASTVMPEVNRIWSSAKIEWTLSGVAPATTRAENRADVINYVLQATRDSEGHGDPERIRKLQSILKLDQEDARAVNIYVIPYLGGTSQGNTSPRQKRIQLGAWTDKPSRGKQPPEKCLLVEPGEFKQGSFSRTVAHELGHILGLKHPAPNTPPFHLLMGGNHPGNDLTAEEKALALKTAADLSATVPPH